MSAAITTQVVARFAALFDGLDIAFGTGKGEWVKRPPRPDDFRDHLCGAGPGIGIAPLRPDNMVKFAAIDLDEPDFDAAREMQKYIPGTSFIEKSRSGNAHVWVFFREPCAAWVAMGILKEATLAAGKMHVEVFPKNPDFARVKLGNYINLPYHGDSRKILTDTEQLPYTLEGFLESAEASGQDPAEWDKKAKWLMIPSPEERAARSEQAGFGQQERLHICAEYVIENMDTNPLSEGHRNAVLFMLAKQLTNWKHCSSSEALDIMRAVNEAGTDPESDNELRRILGNVERGQYTSTGCDDPLVAPFIHPDCPIVHPRR